MWDNSPECSAYLAKVFRQNGEELLRLCLHKVSSACDQLVVMATLNLEICHFRQPVSATPPNPKQPPILPHSEEAPERLIDDVFYN